MNHSRRWKRVLLYSFSGISLLLSLLIFSSCELENVEVSFSRVYIRNLLSTNTIDRITNIEMMPYDADTMAGTVNQIKSPSLIIKNTGLSNFINNQDIFPWENSSSLAIEYGQSYFIHLDDCKQPTIIRIVSGYTNSPLPLTEYDEKYFYALLEDPARCGFNYYIEIKKP